MVKDEIVIENGEIKLRGECLTEIYSISTHTIYTYIFETLELNTVNSIDNILKQFLNLFNISINKNVEHFANELIKDSKFTLANELLKYYDLEIDLSLEDINFIQFVDLNYISKVDCKSIDNLKNDTLKIINKYHEKINVSLIQNIYNKYNIPDEYEPIISRIYHNIISLKKNMLNILLYKNKQLFDYGLKHGYINAIMELEDYDYRKSIHKEYIIQLLKYYFGHKNYNSISKPYRYGINYPEIPTTINEEKEVLFKNNITLVNLRDFEYRYGGATLDSDSLNKLRARFAKYILKDDRRARWLTYKKPFNADEYILQKEDLHD